MPNGSFQMIKVTGLAGSPQAVQFPHYGICIFEAHVPKLQTPAKLIPPLHVPKHQTPAKLCSTFLYTFLLVSATACLGMPF